MRKLLLPGWCGPFRFEISESEAAVVAKMERLAERLAEQEAAAQTVGEEIEAALESTHAKRLAEQEAAERAVNGAIEPALKSTHQDAPGGPSCPKSKTLREEQESFVRDYITRTKPPTKSGVWDAWREKYVGREGTRDEIHGIFDRLIGSEKLRRGRPRKKSRGK
jgi:hypothetical protein